MNKPNLLKFLYLYLVMSVFSIGYTQESGQKYAYQFRASDGVTWIYWVDPITLEATPHISIPAQEGESIGEGYLSPTGEWFAYRNYTRDLDRKDGLNLFNLSTGETIKVIEDVKYPNLDIHGFAYDLTYPVFAWSPNGRYFALHFESGREQQSTYMYNINTRTLHHLGGENINQYHLSWSKDGEKLALLQVSCCDPAEIHIYDASIAELKSRIDISTVRRNGDMLSACDFQWSPTSEYLTFIEGCEGAATITTRDLQLVHIASGKLTNITNITPEDFMNYVVFSASIHPIWINNSTIVLGIEVIQVRGYFENNQLIVDEFSKLYKYTILYSVPNQHSQLLDWRNLVNWSVGKNGKVGYLVQGEPIYLPDQVNPTVPYTMEIARFDGQKLTPIASGSQGCDPQWDVDGEILAYRELERWTSCELSVGDAIIFLDETGMRRFPLAEGMHPLGWFTPSIP